jgi:hypothetical protein
LPLCLVIFFFDLLLLFFSLLPLRGIPFQISWQPPSPMAVLFITLLRTEGEGAYKSSCQQHELAIKQAEPGW